MTVSHEQTLETPKINLGEFDPTEHYEGIEDEAERRLDTPELNSVLEVAAEEGLLEQDVYNKLQKTKGDEHYRLKEEIFGNLNPRDLRKGLSKETSSMTPCPRKTFKLPPWQPPRRLE